MNDDLFTIEEENLICIFDVSSRDILIAELTAALQGFDEPELLEIADNALRILLGMTDALFSEYVFSPAYFNDDDESEV